jgi:hypothetical protein
MSIREAKKNLLKAAVRLTAAGIQEIKNTGAL